MMTHMQKNRFENQVIQDLFMVIESACLLISLQKSSQFCSISFKTCIYMMLIFEPHSTTYHQM